MTWAAVAVLAAAGVAGWRLSTDEQLVLVVGLALPPLGVALAAGSADRRRLTGWIAIGLGALAVTGGVLQTRRTGALSLLRLDYTPRQIATSAADSMAPVGIAALGVVLLLGGVALVTGVRLLGLLAFLLTLGLQATVAVLLTGLAIRPTAYRGGVVDRSPIVAAAVLVLAGLVLLAVLVVSRGGAAPEVSRQSWIAAAVAVAAVAALGGGAYAWTHRQFEEQGPAGDLFADTALAACIERTAGGTSGRRLATVYSLSCNGDLSTAGRIRSLAGVERLPNLHSISVPQNEITDLAPLAGVRLRGLDLANNGVTDLGALRGQDGLEVLKLHGTGVSDLAPVAGLRSLRELDAGANRVTDLTPLRGLTAITELDVSDNRISDLAPLAGLTRLDRLTLRGNEIADLRPLGGLRTVTMLDVARNRVTDVRPLTALAGVDELWLGENPVRDLRPLTGMPALAGVDLEGVAPAVPGREELRARGVYVGGGA